LSAPPTASDQAPIDDRAHTRWFVAEVHRHDALLKNYVRSTFPSVRDVDDVVQESYLRVWRRQMVKPITQVTGSVKASVKGFLFQVARRLALDTIRHERASPIDAVRNMDSLAHAEDAANGCERACSNEEFELLLEAINSLPARCREIIVLRKLEGISPTEVAQRLGISVETVNVHARRGLLKLQAFMAARERARGGKS
jgi:RNA polymerase sigma-70 factor (ECF subfamily)